MASTTTLYGLRIKSIQRGSVTFGTGGSGTVTVSAVDPNKSVLFTTCRPAYSGRDFAGLLGISHESHMTTVFAGATLTNGTTISWLGGTAMNNVTTGTGTLRWELVEYY